nr:LuxR C-terminal-related transcriptional regulator [Arthrobacter sp. OY3WO11]
MAPAEISASLFLSRTTVHNHVEHIYTKLGATNRVGATLFEVGLQPPEPGPLDTKASTRSASTARPGRTPSVRHHTGWH